MELIRKITGNIKSQQRFEPQILDEAVHFQKECIFIAVPKTGTTSLRRQLKQKGLPLIKNPHLNIMQIRDSLYVFFLHQALGTNKDFPSESVPSDADLRAKAKEVFDSFFKFSAFRNPWARALSMYSRRERVPVKDKLSFKGFCENHLYASDTCKQPTLHQNQLDWLCDENGKCIMDYVYKLENFNQAIKEIAELTDGRLRFERKKANRNPNSHSRSYRQV